MFTLGRPKIKISGRPIMDTLFILYKFLYTLTVKKMKLLKNGQIS